MYWKFCCACDPAFYASYLRRTEGFHPTSARVNLGHRTCSWFGDQRHIWPAVHIQGYETLSILIAFGVFRRWTVDGHMRSVDRHSHIRKACDFLKLTLSGIVFCMIVQYSFTNRERMGVVFLWAWQGPSPTNDFRILTLTLWRCMVRMALVS